MSITTFEAIGDKYGFPVIAVDENVKVMKAKNTDGKYIDWIRYNIENETVTLVGNTDNCNIWLYETRKDFTPEKIVAFVSDLNYALSLHDRDRLKLCELIDPEDWQEIAGINDAHLDARYLF